MTHSRTGKLACFIKKNQVLHQVFFESAANRSEHFVLVSVDQLLVDVGLQLADEKPDRVEISSPDRATQDRLISSSVLSDEVDVGA